MALAGTPPNEAERSTALASYDLVGAEGDPGVEALVSLAARLCEMPMAIVSLVGPEREWFLSSVGMGSIRATTRAGSFCSYTILDNVLLEIEDATKDDRFKDNEYVVGEPCVRFYAGWPLIDGAGHALGALCVLDREPRKLTETQARALQELTTAVVGLLDARRAASQRRIAIETARSTAADLGAVLDAVPAYVAYTDRELKNRFANNAYAKLFGRTSETISGLHVREIIGAEVFARTRHRFDAALRGEAQTFDREIEGDGARRDVRVTLSPDTRDGKVFGYVSTMIDVTELRDLLRRSERRADLLGMAEDIGDVGHWRMEVATGRVYWSPVVYRLHGLDPASFTPNTESIVAFFHPDDRALVHEDTRRVIVEQEPFELERRIVRKDGAIRRVTTRGRAEVDPVTGRTTAVIGVLQDITERWALRERMERQERLVTTGTLAAGVGHEINNPLTYVAANVDFALEELRVIGGASPSSRMREVVSVLQEAREGAERIRKIVRGLRAFAREDTLSVPTDVHSALEMSINMAMHELRQRATLEVQRGHIRPVFADESRLSQVFVNLLVNAAQAFSNGDTSKNRVTVTTRQAPDDQVVIEVSDNGAGMPPDVLARIFDPFFTTKPIGHGTGLGLSICHNVVTALGGEITCSTVLGHGTTFKVTLPAAPSHALSGPPPAVNGPGRGRVLVVDDEESVLRALVRLLSPEHDVTALVDARDALKRLVDDAEEFDIVFCDVMMPQLSGMELYRRVRAYSESMAERFVFVTGGTVYEEVRKFLDSIANERLEKPFSNQNLKGVARRFVALNQRRNSTRASA